MKNSLFFLVFALLLFAVPSLASKPQVEVSEISLEHTGCYGHCPVYKIVLRSDGTATYIGKSYVKLQGTYQGVIDHSDFDKLANLLEARDFFSLKDKYDDISITCQDTAIVTVKRNEQNKQVESYNNAAPSQFNEIEKEIERVMANIKWKKQK